MVKIFERIMDKFFYYSGISVVMRVRLNAFNLFNQKMYTFCGQQSHSHMASLII